MALVGCARRLGAPARSKEVRGTDRVSVRDADAIGVLIAAMGGEVLEGHGNRSHKQMANVVRRECERYRQRIRDIQTPVERDYAASIKELSEKAEGK